MNAKALSDIRRKLPILEYGKQICNVSKACRHFGISRETYYQWKRDYEREGEKALINSKPCPENPNIRVPKHVEELIIYLRTYYYLGQLRISSHLKRYHDITVSQSGVYSVLKRNELNRLPQNQRKHSMEPFKQYEKQAPGHRTQIDEKCLYFTDVLTKQEVRCFQYMDIDDATRPRVLQIYDRHSQKNANDFVDRVRKKFPFRIHTIQTDNGHEFQAQFHWHCEDLGIQHVYIKKASLHQNGKEERSHLTDQQEFYQLVEYVDDIDILKKLKEWEAFYNLHRPNAALHGKTSYKVLREKVIPTYFFPFPSAPKKGRVRKKITFGLLSILVRVRT